MLGNVSAFIFFIFVLVGCVGAAHIEYVSV